MKLSDALKELAEPIGRDEKIHSIIERAARRAGMTYSRCYEHWYGRAKLATEDEMRGISDAIQQKREQEAKNELHELKLRLLRLESRLSQADSDFHRPTIDFIGRTVRDMG